MYLPNLFQQIVIKKSIDVNKTLCHRPDFEIDECIGDQIVSSCDLFFATHIKSSEFTIVGLVLNHISKSKATCKKKHGPEIR
jgi:hypothetical protein